MNNFKIIDKIGEGTYSTVYTVIRLSDGKQYALKKVKIKNLSIKEKQNSLNEVRILASIHSNYVISYKESFVDKLDETLCLVMEYADEGDLFQKITFYKKNNLLFEEKEIWQIFLQITKGLNELHKKNILHRDLKSANVFLFKDGTAKLGDLNVSKIAHRGLGCTQTGTPYYASPEVWKDNPYDLKSDIWSLGCIIYEMCNLKTPFRANTMEGIYKKIIKGDYPKINKKFSEDLGNVIGAMLQLSPNMRPTTDTILTYPECVERIEQYEIFKNDNSNLEIGVDNKNNECSSSNINNSGSNDNESLLLYEDNSNLLFSNRNNANSNIINNNNKFKLPTNENESKITKESNSINYNNESRKIKLLNNAADDQSRLFRRNQSCDNKLSDSNFEGVMDTIHIPKKLIYLNKKLPTPNYETDILRNIETNNENKPINDDEKYKLYLNRFMNVKNMSFPNKQLPIIKTNFSKQSEDLINNSAIKAKNIINNNNNSNSIEPFAYKAETPAKLINDNKLIRRHYSRLENEKMSTVQLKLLKKAPLFPFRGKINVIVEEDEFKRPKIMSKSVNKLKDVKFLYNKYIPQSVNNQRYDISNYRNPFGIGNYSYSLNNMKGDFLGKNYFNYLNLGEAGNNFRNNRLIPVKRVKVLK